MYGGICIEAVIPALKRQGQEEFEFKTSLCYIENVLQKPRPESVAHKMFDGHVGLPTGECQ